MAVRIATGFAGIQRFANQTINAAKRAQLAYEAINIIEMQSTNNADVTSMQGALVADAIFPDRNQLTLRRTYTGPVGYWPGWKTHVYQYDPANATSGSINPDEIIYGFTWTSNLKSSGVQATVAQNILVCLWDAVKATNSTTAINAATAGHILCWLCANQYDTDGVTPKWRFFQAQQNPTVPSIDAETDTLPFALDGVQNHLEFRVSKVTKRVRIWLNGVLCKDFTLPAGVTAEQATRGFAVYLARDGSQYTQIESVTFGNIYMLEVDDIHTSQLGPGARVMEFSPASDTEAQYRRDTTRFPLGNYQVAAQYYDATSRGMLTAMDAGTHDTYGGLSGIASQASEIYGAVSKFNATNLAGGVHTMAAQVTYKGASYTTGSLTLQTTGAFTMGADVSRDPSTNAKWEVEDLANASTGFQLTS